MSLMMILIVMVAIVAFITAGGWVLGAGLDAKSRSLGAGVGFVWGTSLAVVVGFWLVVIHFVVKYW